MKFENHLKKIISLVAIFLAGSYSSFSAAIPGRPAPAFKVKDLAGKIHQLGDYKGKIVVLEAYNLDCPFCAKHFKSNDMQKLQKDLRAQGVIWLLVNSVNKKHPSYRKPAAAKKEFTRLKINATAWLDDSAGKLGRAYGLKTTPHIIVIDKQGNVAYNGAIDDDPTVKGNPRQARNYVREAVRALRAGDTVAVSQTKPYGCGIKY